MMFKIIVSKKGQSLGGVLVEKKSIKADFGLSAELSSLIERAKKGITRLRDIKTTDGYRLVEEPIDQSDKNYHLALLNWFKRQGYTAMPDDSKIITKLESLLGLLDDQALRNQLKRELPTLTYLEKTYLLEAMRQRKNKDESADVSNGI